jgi:hypothetical protein
VTAAKQTLEAMGRVALVGEISLNAIVHKPHDVDNATRDPKSTRNRLNSADTFGGLE